jgi:hypothetical protein
VLAPAALHRLTAYRELAGPDLERAERHARCGLVLPVPADGGDLADASSTRTVKAVAS